MSIVFVNILIAIVFALISDLDPAMPENDAILIEDFSKGTTGQFPQGWGWVEGLKVKKISEAKAGQVPYVIAEENGNKFLHADDTGQAVTIVSDKKWNVKKYPCLSWRWRVREFPMGANERRGKSDSAGGLYVTYYISFSVFRRASNTFGVMKYPLCDIFKREGTGKATMTVVESGTGKKDVWVTETINIYEHYKKVFGEYPPDEIAGIAIRTDADGTNSRAIADYDDIKALKFCDGQCD